METIAKFLKAFFFSEDGEVDNSIIAKFKKALTWIIVGGGITFGGLLYWADDEDTEYADDNVEYVETIDSTDAE